MAGKVASAWKEKRYRNYWCSRATKSKALCAHYNGHSAPKLEQAILEYLGQYSDPDLVKGHLSAAETKEMLRRETELKQVEKALNDLEGQFTKHLDYLKRGVLSEEEFVKANEACRTQAEALQNRKDELDHWVEMQHDIRVRQSAHPGKSRASWRTFRAYTCGDKRRIYRPFSKLRIFIRTTPLSWNSGNSGNVFRSA